MAKDYLAEFDAAAEAEKQVLVNQWIAAEPLSFFKQLREQRPVLVTPEAILVASFNDVCDILQSPTIFTTQLYLDKLPTSPKNPGHYIGHDDNALHTREKSLMQAILNRDDLPDIQQLIKNAAVQIVNAANGSIDLVTEYSRVIPATLVQEYFGFDGIEKEQLLKWSYWNQYNSFFNHGFHLNSKDKIAEIEKKQAECYAEMIPVLKPLLLKKLLQIKTKDRLLGLVLAIKNRIRKTKGKAPLILKDDIIKRMLRTSGVSQLDFSLIRVGSNAASLLVGTVETTSRVVVNAVEYFLQNPELLEKAKAVAKAEDTKEFDAMVWEALRFSPMTPYLFRKASQDYTIAKGTPWETKVPMGATVLPLIQSAMFDSYANDEPDIFKTDRNWYHNFNLGFGSHDCVGKYIGMVMIPEMVRQIIIQENLKAVAPVDYKDGPFPERYRLEWSS